MTSETKRPLPKPEVVPIHLGSGRVADLTFIRSGDVSIRNIAASLSKICRFNGHTREFYSVAEHSMMVAKLLPDELKLYGLLHDAHEAFLGDISAPVQRLFYDHGLDLALKKHHIDEAVWQAVSVRPPNSFECIAIDGADEIMLRTEVEQLMLAPDYDCYGFKINAADISLQCLGPETAQVEWLQKFRQYYNLLDGNKRLTGCSAEAMAGVL